MGQIEKLLKILGQIEKLLKIIGQIEKLLKIIRYRTLDRCPWR